jgi:hypothetical protein
MLGRIVTYQSSGICYVDHNKEVREVIRTLWCMTVIFTIYGAAHGQSFREKACSYSNLKTNVSVDGPCVLTQTKINGNFGYIVTFPQGVKVTVEYVDSSGPDHTWRINGQSGWGFEINREHLHGATLDLSQSIEWQDR